MKLNFKTTMNIIISLMLNNFLINISLANSISSNPVYITDMPNSKYNNSGLPFAKFIKSLKKYKHAIILSVNWDNKLYIQSLKGEEFSFKFRIVNCLKGIKCNKDIAFSKTFSKKFNKLIIEEMFVKSTNQQIKTETFYFVLFSNRSVEITNNPGDSNSEYMIFTSMKELDRWLLFLKMYGLDKLEEDLNDFMLEINNKSTSCIKKKSPYCMLKSNKKNEIKDFIRLNKLHSITSSLLLDFAYMTKNHEMALYLTVSNTESIKFPTLKLKIYAASYYNLVEVLDYLTKENTENKLDEIYDNGLTVLAVAVANNSKDVIKYLIGKGSKDVGNYLNRFYIVPDEDGKQYSKNIDFLFEQLKKKYYKSKSIPELLQKLTYLKVNYNMIVENRLNWLKKISIEDKNLFDAVFIEKDYYSRKIFLGCMFSSTEKIFNSLVEQGLDFCLAFDHKSQNILNMEEIQNGGAWLGKNWISNKYKIYKKQCKD